MKFELAKQLKDAGFTQFGEGHALILNRKLPESDQTVEEVSWRDFVRIARDGNSPEFLYAPTLSELIEACGKHVDIEIRETKSWARKLVGSIDIVKGEGSTPEEAVAKLWLALNHG